MGCEREEADRGEVKGAILYSGSDSKSSLSLTTKFKMCGSRTPTPSS